MNYGLLEDKIRDFAEYVLGGSKVPYVPYREDGNWEDYLPKYENQTTKQGQETSACTAYGSLSQIETLYSFLYKEEPNYSERFTYLLVPITPGRGTDPQKTYETIRSRGVVDEKYLPMTDTLSEYLDKSDLNGSLLAKGQNWLVKHEFKHEWLWTTRPANYIEILKDALKTSPLGVSVSAWNKEGDVYVSYGDVNNHFCLLYKFDDEGYPWVFDTYDHSRKKLSKNHNIRRAKRIWLQKRTKPAMRMDIKTITQVIKRLLSMKPTLSDIVRKNLNIDVTPRDTTPDSVACVDVGTTILRQLYPEVPHMESTIVADKWFSNPENGWVKISTPEENCIVISPTEGPRIGHFGFVMANGLIASNNSFGIYAGKITENYTWQTWLNKFKGQLGLEVNLYRKA